MKEIIFLIFCFGLCLGYGIAWAFMPYYHKRKYCKSFNFLGYLTAGLDDNENPDVFIDIKHTDLIEDAVDNRIYMRTKYD